MINAKKNIIIVRQGDFPEEINDLATAVDSIIKYFKKNGTISEKQQKLLDSFNDIVENYDFYSEIKTDYLINEAEKTEEFDNFKI